MEECNHKGYYRIVNGLHIVVRYCVQCGKSWRMPTQGDYRPHIGLYPDALWEVVDEPPFVAFPVLPSYEE